MSKKLINKTQAAVQRRKRVITRLEDNIIREQSLMKSIGEAHKKGSIYAPLANQLNNPEVRKNHIEEEVEWITNMGLNINREKKEIETLKGRI